MNGKCRRVKGCWSRGITRGRYFNYIANKKLFFNLNFSQQLKNLINDEQKNLLSFFENYHYVNKIERYSYNSNTPYSTIYLFNKDFENGTQNKKTWYL